MNDHHNHHHHHHHIRLFMDVKRSHTIQQQVKMSE